MIHNIIITLQILILIVQFLKLLKTTNLVYTILVFLELPRKLVNPRYVFYHPLS